ncbi:MAG: hypothetical protein O7F73_20740, partial [Gammaproteobacteria bacterium]|nr:hypothetical protein [Gammaproteobacteria bacterium]
EEALVLYETHFPELLRSSPGTFNRNNFKAAIDLAHLLKSMGRQADAEQLLGGAWSYIQGIPRLGEAGSWVDDVRIHTLRGETELALTALSKAVQAGWRHYWRYYLEHDPILEPLRGEPRFQAVVDDIHSDMAEQLERVNSKSYDFGLCND